MAAAVELSTPPLIATAIVIGRDKQSAISYQPSAVGGASRE
jgi:hypothetical protein